MLEKDLKNLSFVSVFFLLYVTMSLLKNQLPEVVLSSVCRLQNVTFIMHIIKWQEENRFHYL